MSACKYAVVIRMNWVGKFMNQGFRALSAPPGAAMPSVRHLDYPKVLERGSGK